jgi:hypothetical protein
MPLPPNTLAELQRDMARLGFVMSQIREMIRVPPMGISVYLGV